MSKIDDLIAELCLDGVERIPLGQLTTNFDRQRKPVTKSNRVSGSYPYYGANGIQDYVQDYIFDGVFLLIGEDGSVKNSNGTPVLNWAEGKIWVNNHAHILQSSSDDLDLRYLYYFLQTVDISSFVTGGTQPKLNQKNMNAIPVAVPPLEIQREIVRILDTFSKMEAELEAELESRKQQYEYYASRLWETEIDQHCEWKTLDEVADVRDGTHDSPRRVSEGFPLVTSKNITSGYVDLRSAYMISGEDYRQINARSQVDQWDVLVSMIGTVGEVAIVEQEPEFAIKNVGLIKCGSEQVARYLVYYLRSPRAKGLLLSQLNGTGQKYLALGKLRKLPVPWLSEGSQIRITSQLRAFDALVNDLSSGLPAEIAARRKQYEYYRDKLLTFKELEVAS